MPEEPAGNHANARLDSWKEIAAYLRRDERTVRRWEKSENLPVHRHTHQRRASVYAYRHELDAWWNNRKPRLETENGPSKEKPRGHGYPWSGAAIVALIVVALVWTAMGRLPRESDEPSTLVMQRVFTDAQRETIPWGSCHGTTSDGRWLACVLVNDGNVGTIDTETAEYRALTSRGSWEEGEWGTAAIFSPDGREVAFAWRKPAGVLELRAVEVETSRERVLFRSDTLRGIEPLDWSRDGSLLLARVATAESAERLVLVDPSDGSRRILKELGSDSVSGASFAPDGREVVYAMSPGSSPERHLYLLPVDGGEATQLTDLPARDRDPVWLDDGLFFMSDRTGTNDLWRLSIDSGARSGAAEAELVQRDLGRVIVVAFSRSGRLYYQLQTGLVDVFTMEVDPISGDVAEEASLSTTAFRGTNISPAFSPDGAYLAYVSRRGRVYYGPDAMSLVIRDLSSGRERVLEPELSFFNGALWSPDGQSISVRGADYNETLGDYAVDVETGAARLIKGGLQGFPVWTPDGSSLLYLRYDNAARHARLVRRDLESGDESILYAADGAPAGVRIARAHAADWVAIPMRREASGSSVLLLWSPSGEPREILEMTDPDGFVIWDFTPDDRFVVVTRVTQNSKAVELLRVSVEDGSTEALYAMDTLRDVSVHPSGSRIAFTAGEPTLELYVLENFLDDVRSGSERRAALGAPR